MPAKWTCLLAFLVGLAISQGFAAAPEVTTESDGVSIGAAPSDTATVGPDYPHAKPLPLPQADYSRERARLDTIDAVTRPPDQPDPAKRSGVSPGYGGNGEQHPVKLEAPAPQNGGAAEHSRVGAPQNYGSSLLPFTTARADLQDQATNTLHPYRAAGKLFYFVSNGDTYTCSASLIRRGIAVTAAHCVAKFGSGTTYTGFQFIPGYRGNGGAGDAPYGIWTGRPLLLDSWLKGTNPCSQSGVVCQDDVAVLLLDGKKDDKGNTYYPGDNTGFFGYQWAVGPFAKGNIIQLSQLGYPACLDAGEFMERTDAQGVRSPNDASNTVFGSLMCEGSSGGPLSVDFGLSPFLTSTGAGLWFAPNTLVGVTSWGATDNSIKRQGASPFLESNVQLLVISACEVTPDGPDACGSQGTISVTVATYGSGKVLPIFQNLCNNKRSCSIPINNNTMGGDPSPGQPKDSVYAWGCPPNGKSNYSSRTSENSTAHLYCW
jgi:V8-like Glu-specific endopeptidase